MSEPAPPAPPTPPSRWLGLDALRGISILAMILVNNPGAWGEQYQYPQLDHAGWHGCTFTDLVFPTFLFCAGVAIVPALTKKLAAGLPRGPLVASIARRVGLLVLFGMLLSAFPLITLQGDEPFAPLWRTRFPGVLQRIGVCYGMAALLFVFTTVRTQRWVLWGCLVGYWLLITLVPVPGVGAPNLDGPMTTLEGWVDRAMFGQHIYVKGQYDPEGLLSTIPALATCMLGIEAGRVLSRGGDLVASLATLLRRGTLLMALGAVWGWFLPFNKPLWTSSYAVWTAGIATVGLGLCVWAFEQQPWTKWAYPLRVYGQNALLVFIGSGLCGRIVGRLWQVTSDGKEISAQQWFFRHVLLGPIGEPRLASLAFAILWVLGWYCVLAVLYRRRIIWRV